MPTVKFPSAPRGKYAVRSVAASSSAARMREITQGDRRHLRQLRSVILWGGLLGASTWGVLIALISR